jgi:hypothetical protein
MVTEKIVTGREVKMADFKFDQDHEEQYPRRGEGQIGEWESRSEEWKTRLVRGVVIVMEGWKDGRVEEWERGNAEFGMSAERATQDSLG